MIEIEEVRSKNAPLKLEREQAAAKRTAAVQPESKISLHPKAVKNFSAAIENLTPVLWDNGKRPSAQIIRSIVDCVVVTPVTDKLQSCFQRRALHVKIEGRLNALLCRVATTSPVGELGGSEGGT